MIRTLLRKGCSLISSPQFHQKQSQFILIPKFNPPKTLSFFSNQSNTSHQNPQNKDPIEDVTTPEDIKQKTQAKLDELAEKVESNVLGDKEAYEQLKTFEDEIVAEYVKKDEGERPIESDEVIVPVDNKSDDPPGVGPILRWQTRVVFAQGGDAGHPKNRMVKLQVTVKELGLSKYQSRRLREIVGTRYHPGKDELTISSQRFEHREENRKDCLRTLVNIIEEAGKANTLIDEARTTYVKERLKANPAFMARLHAKTKQAPPAVPA